MSYDLQITKGISFQASINLTDNNNTPIDLSNLIVSSYIKNYYSDTGHVADFDPQIINATGGSIIISLTPGDTENLPIGIGVYDVVLTTGDVKLLALAGNVYISPSV